VSALACPECRGPLLLVTNRPGCWLCPVCRATVEDLDLEAWRAELTDLRDRQRAAAIATMRIWRRDADHLPETGA
jgi:uncharacterized protein YbaR (Trm112 family)